MFAFCFATILQFICSHLLYLLYIITTQATTVNCSLFIKCDVYNAYFSMYLSNFLVITNHFRNEKYW